MHLHRSLSGWVVQAPAKLNLFFEILGKRSDGFHEIETLVTPIDLYDSLYVQPEADSRVRFSCRRPPGYLDRAEEDIPNGAENLVVRAVELLRRRAGVERGATIRLVKRIPSAAGLGGGSSDAAGALAAANQAWQLGWPNERLAELGAELGSDVPLFFAAGPAVCRGRGEHVAEVGPTATLHFVVVRPPAGLSTAAVYKACRPAATARDVQPLTQAMARGDVGRVGQMLFNRLETAAEELTTWIGRLRSEMAALEVLGHQMSGSGSCYFGLCHHARHARRAAGRLLAKGVGIAWAVRSCR